MDLTRLASCRAFRSYNVARSGWSTSTLVFSQVFFRDSFSPHFGVFPPPNLLLLCLVADYRSLPATTTGAASNGFCSPVFHHKHFETFCSRLSVRAIFRWQQATSSWSNYTNVFLLPRLNFWDHSLPSPWPQSSPATSLYLAAILSISDCFLTNWRLGSIDHHCHHLHLDVLCRL